MEMVSGDNWNYKTCKAPVNSTNHYRDLRDLSTVTDQQCQSIERYRTRHSAGQPCIHTHTHRHTIRQLVS